MILCLHLTDVRTLEFADKSLRSITPANTFMEVCLKFNVFDIHSIYCQFQRRGTIHIYHMGPSPHLHATTVLHSPANKSRDATMPQLEPAVEIN